MSYTTSPMLGSWIGTLGTVDWGTGGNQVDPAVLHSQWNQGSGSSIQLVVKQTTGAPIGTAVAKIEVTTTQ